LKFHLSTSGEDFNVRMTSVIKVLIPTYNYLGAYLVLLPPVPTHPSNPKITKTQSDA
jgi:hypothetical protein